MMTLGARNTRNEAAILYELMSGAAPASLFRIITLGGTRSGIGGTRTLQRLINAGLVSYRSRTFASDLDPIVEITDAGIEALRAYKRGERQRLVEAK